MSISPIQSNTQANSDADIYTRLEHANPIERTEIFLNYAKENWPTINLSDGKRRANLQEIDLRPETIQSTFNHLLEEDPPWWNSEENFVQLNEASLVAANFSYAKLDSVDFSNTELQGARFFQAELNRANMTEANLNLANFDCAKAIDAEFPYACLEGITAVSAIFCNANFGGSNMKNSILTGASLAEADLTEANLLEAHITRTNFSNASFVRTKIQSLNFTQSTIFGISWEDAYFDHTILTFEQLGEMISEERYLQYRQAKRAYMQLKQNFEKIGDYEAASLSYRKERIMGRKEIHYKVGEAFSKSEHKDVFILRFKWLANLIIDLTCSYGESFSRVIACFVLTLCVFGPIAISLSGGLYWQGTPLETYNSINSPFQKQAYYYLQVFIYTLDTLTTASFSELKPANDVVRLISGALAFIGIFLAGLLGFVAGNRIRRF